MDHFDSEESSSGCESGWTLYLDHYSCKHAHDQHTQQHDEADDDDNMSMVSDASSGPPHFQQHQEQDEDEDEDEYNNNGGFCHPMMFGSRKRRKILEQTSFFGHRHLQDLPASLDDTASSPFFTFCNEDLKVCTKEGLMEDDNSFDYSQGHSTTYFEMV